jgi:predicted nucleotidyltransferase
MSHTANLRRIKEVFNALGPLQNEVVFVGGATVSLYVDRMSEEARPTYDIDVVVEIWTYKAYAAIEEQLRSMGFVNDRESGIICRYIIRDITVDIMPTGEDVLFFRNKWYSEGYKNAIPYSTDDCTFKIFTSPYFIASKIDAFRDRGRNEGRTSADVEDIVYVLENRSSIWDEFLSAPINVKEYLKSEFTEFLSYSSFREWVDAHVSYNSPPSTPYIIARLTEFCAQ